MLVENCQFSHDLISEAEIDIKPKFFLFTLLELIFEYHKPNSGSTIEYSPLNEN